ncbi:UNVERIFIED_CONTAM: hypothetical protein FKN15_001895 [Acipenser sinensis]
MRSLGQDVERGQGSRSYGVIRREPGFSESKELKREVGGKGRDEISFVSGRVTVPEGTRESAGGERVGGGGRNRGMRLEGLGEQRGREGRGRGVRGQNNRDVRDSHSRTGETDRYSSGSRSSGGRVQACLVVGAFQSAARFRFSPTASSRTLTLQGNWLTVAKLR